MMEFISIPLVVGICVAGVYGLFELIIRKKERLAIIEKLGDKLDGSYLQGKLSLPAYSSRNGFSFSSLKAGCLLAGIGLGLLVAFIIATSMTANMGSSYGDEDWFRREIVGTVYGASVLLFGGIGLIIAFVIELKMGKK